MIIAAVADSSFAPAVLTGCPLWGDSSDTDEKLTALDRCRRSLPSVSQSVFVRRRRSDARDVHVDRQLHTVVRLDNVEHALPHIRERMSAFVRLAVRRKSLRAGNPELGRSRD